MNRALHHAMAISLCAAALWGAAHIGMLPGLRGGAFLSFAPHATGKADTALRLLPILR
ncbi:hypothetical protein J3E64_003214 [Sphingobium sp. OAS761]|uniref:hypothetical protein n=1 Tax=Sphingobium sp. OAS761 TaxID=2817901 RepID=UPI00209FF3CB|nr:hypothetical protein [Sphingobium sp. OAS761]MCP1471503.1 hypothetical protein [Sphingobium sp. OAS761]